MFSLFVRENLVSKDENKANVTRLNFLQIFLLKRLRMYFAPQIISAQQLPKIDTDKVSSIVDPQVWVEIHGVAIDNARNKTQRIDNNGKVTHCFVF